MDICYPPDTDWSCKFTEEELVTLRADAVEAAKLEKAEAFAWGTLAALTAYRIGTCPVTVRPCAARCMPQGSFLAAPVGSGGMLGVPSIIGRLSPYISGGRWYNACPCTKSDACSCTALSEVILPGPVGKLVSVSIDGETVPRSAYRIDNGNRLVRTDGGEWPSCQDMAATSGEGVFAVTYYQGVAPNLLTRAAAGVLAAEFLASCEGQECRLPWNVVNIARSGESIEFGDGGLQGVADAIPEVAAVVMMYNPYGLKSQPFVASPDMYSTRRTTA